MILAAVAADFGSIMLPLIAQAQVSQPEAQVIALEGLLGKQAGFRRSQAKGVCASGYFVGNAVGRALSSASVFKGDRIPVVARFSVGGGNPKTSDKGRSVRGLSLQFTLPNGEQWLTANISAPMYFVAKPEQFAPFLQVRTADPTTPVSFDFKVQLGEKDDQLTDSTKVWPDSRKVTSVGKLVIDKVEAAAGGACDKITFSPLVLPKGMKPSADPVLLARPAPYAVSLGRRLTEATN